MAIQLSVLLDDMALPVSLTEPLLLLALQDAADQIAPFGADDWEAFAWARRLTRERVEAYMQGLRRLEIIGRPGAGGSKETSGR
jgi:hypothetical protein